VRRQLGESVAAKEGHGSHSGPFAAILSGAKRWELRTGDSQAEGCWPAWLWVLCSASC
jgi:hypothetical protein